MNRHKCRHIIEFEGDSVKGEKCLSFKMKADHSSDNCAFCNKEYSDDLRWDMFQCVSVGGTVELWQDPSCEENYITCFNVCNHCREHSNAVEFIRENHDKYRRIYFENASDDRLFWVDDYSGLNY